MLGLTLDREELDRALGSVSRIAQHYGEELQKTYGGKKTFEDPAPEPPPVPETLRSDGTGLYDPATRRGRRVLDENVEQVKGEGSAARQGASSRK